VGSAECGAGNPIHAPIANSDENGTSSLIAAILSSHRRITAALSRASNEKRHKTPELQQDCHR
jgi:hypothetical protein